MFCNGAMGVGGWTMMVIAWGGLAALLVWAISGARDRGGAGSALAILDRRFAAGEIDRDEFEERRRTLTMRP